MDTQHFSQHFSFQKKMKIEICFLFLPNRPARELQWPTAENGFGSLRGGNERPGSVARPTGAAAQRSQRGGSGARARRRCPRRRCGAMPAGGQRPTPAERGPASGRTRLAERWPPPERSARGSREGENAGGAERVLGGRKWWRGGMRKMAPYRRRRWSVEVHSEERRRWQSMMREQSLGEGSLRRNGAMEQAAAAASVREGVGRAAVSLRAKERVSEGGGGSRGAGALTRSRERGGHGRPRGGRRRRMAATGR
jgi:hypothetical protein